MKRSCRCRRNLPPSWRGVTLPSCSPRYPARDIEQDLVWFWRDDGSVKTGEPVASIVITHGARRADRWIAAFRNREVHAGESVTAAVGPEDEWVAEAYMQTDYSTLTQADRRSCSTMHCSRSTPAAEDDDEDSGVDELAQRSWNKLDMNKMVRTAARCASVGQRRRRSASRLWYPGGLTTPFRRSDHSPPGGSRLLSSFVQQGPFYTAQNVAVDPALILAASLAHRLLLRDVPLTMRLIRRSDACQPHARRLRPAGCRAVLGSMLMTPILTHDGLARAAAPPTSPGDPEMWPDFKLMNFRYLAQGQTLDLKAGDCKRVLRRLG